MPNGKTYSFTPAMHCDMCGSDSSSHRVIGIRLNRTQGLRPKRASGIAVTVKKCSCCELIYSDPQPFPLELSDHYGEPEDYWKPHYFDVEPDYFGREIRRAKQLLNFQPGMRALDIGAGIGKAMRAIGAAGFDSYGIEPSKSFRQLAIERLGISEDRLTLATVEEADFAQETFDFISFGAVLEHVRSPATALERAFGWLKPGGVLQVEVPSSRHLIARLVNLYYQLVGTSFVTNISPMHPPFHLFEFGLKSFEEHGRRVGYEIVHHAYYVCTIYWFPQIFHPMLRRYMDWSNTGMQLEVFLKK